MGVKEEPAMGNHSDAAKRTACGPKGSSGTETRAQSRGAEKGHPAGCGVQDVVTSRRTRQSEEAGKARSKSPLGLRAVRAGRHPGFSP